MLEKIATVLFALLLPIGWGMLTARAFDRLVEKKGSQVSVGPQGKGKGR